MIGRSHVQSLLWALALVVASGLCLALMLKVKAVTSEITRTERRILAVKRERMILETEFQTRARQQQLARWNEVDFGYVAPGADQFIDGRRELAALGKPVMIDAPAPIQLAAADAGDAGDAAGEADIGSAGAGAAAGAAAARGPMPPPARLAMAGPAPAIRQLVARDRAPPEAGPGAGPARLPVRVEPAAISRAPAARPPERPERVAQAGAASFAERFDLDAVIAEARVDGEPGR